jgi:hypothetical protein
MSTANSASIARSGRRAPIALLAAVLGLAAILLGAQPAAAKAPRDFFGIFAEGPSHKDFRGMGDAGFGTQRVPVNWASVQPTRKSEYNWGQPDYGVYNAAANGMRPSLIVYGTPRFVHKSTRKGLHGPEGKADLKEWREFAEALARRYSTNGDYFDDRPQIENLPVKTWVAWNEENSKNNWLPRPDPRAYGRLVKAFDRGVSKVDPKARIVLGGMYGFPRDPKSMKGTKFLEKLYRMRGIEKHFDALNAHPYGSGVGDVKRQVKDLRAVARKAGDRGVGMIVGELGWASKGPDRSESVVGKRGQAKRLGDGLEMLLGKRKRWNILGAWIYTWRDFPAGQIACNWCPWSGLVTKRSKPKPALREVKRVIRRNR